MVFMAKNAVLVPQQSLGANESERRVVERHFRPHPAVPSGARLEGRIVMVMAGYSEQARGHSHQGYPKLLIQLLLFAGGIVHKIVLM